MKKLFLFLLIISFTFFILNNCTDSSIPTITDDEQEQLNVSKKSPKDVTKIISFQIGEYLLIDNDVLKYTNIEDHPVIDISSDVNISYEITSTTGIDIVRVELRYDVNADSEYNFSKIEGDARIFRDTYFETNLKTVVKTNPWNGTVDEEFDENGQLIKSSKIIDQLASYNYPDGVEAPLDHYIVYITAFNIDGQPITLLNKKTYVWITGAEDRSSQRLIVQDIQWNDFIINKNKVTPIVTIKIAQILNDNFANPTPVANAYVDGLWEGLVSGRTDNIYNPVASNTDGIIMLEGDSFRKNKSGTITFTVTNVNHLSDKDNGGPFYVYDPINNTNWTWPEEPYKSVKYPE